MYERIRKAMLDHVDFGNQLVAFPKLPLELQKEALQKALVTLETIISTLKLDVKDFIVDDIEGIYGFDETKITPNKKV
jgi:hypothetical protein